MLDQELYPMARDLAQQGASRAMIISKLRKQGLDPYCSGLVADNALRPIAIRKRARGLVLMLLGVFSLPIALLSRRFSETFVPITLGMLGAFLIMLGAALLFHRTQLKPKGEDSGTRIR